MARTRQGFRVIAFTRDRHPAQHGSFIAQGGRWPVHCVDGTKGFEFHPELNPPPSAAVIDKGVNDVNEGFDPFEGTDLSSRLQMAGVTRVFIAGLATEYCVCATALSSVKSGLETWLVIDAVAPVDNTPGDGDRAILKMRDSGVNLAASGQVTTLLDFQIHPSAFVVVDVQNDFFPGGALAIRDAPRIIAPIQLLLRHSAESGRRVKQLEARS
ncbi:isochorismatase family protein [bacterium]|nr:isochorismatase family protein [bacterium]